MKLDVAEETLKKEVSGKSFYESLKASAILASNHLDESSANIGRITPEQSKVIDEIMESMLANREHMHSVEFGIPYSTTYWPLTEVYFYINNVMVIVNPKAVKISQLHASKALTMPVVTWRLNAQLKDAIASVKSIIGGQV